MYLCSCTVYVNGCVCCAEIRVWWKPLNLTAKSDRYGAIVSKWKHTGHTHTHTQLEHYISSQQTTMCGVFFLHLTRLNEYNQYLSVSVNWLTIDHERMSFQDETHCLFNNSITCPCRDTVHHQKAFHHNPTDHDFCELQLNTSKIVFTFMEIGILWWLRKQVARSSNLPNLISRPPLAVLRWFGGPLSCGEGSLS